MKARQAELKKKEKRRTEGVEELRNSIPRLLLVMAGDLDMVFHPVVQL